MITAACFKISLKIKSNKNLCTFRIENTEILHEYNYVFLKGTCVDELLELICL